VSGGDCSRGLSRGTIGRVVLVIGFRASTTKELHYKRYYVFNIRFPFKSDIDELNQTLDYKLNTNIINRIQQMKWIHRGTLIKEV